MQHKTVSVFEYQVLDVKKRITAVVTSKSHIKPASIRFELVYTEAVNFVGTFWGLEKREEKTKKCKRFPRSPTPVPRCTHAPIQNVKNRS